jgi:hypothetical protein
MLHALAALNGKNLGTEEKNECNKMREKTTAGKAAAELATKHDGMQRKTQHCV